MLFRGFRALWIAPLLLAIFAAHASSRDEAAVSEKLQGFDAYMEKLLHDWNGVGFGVGVVVGEELVFARGYGYRDYGRKIALDAHSLFAIASNTKLFTAVAAGMLVEEGTLTWDRPVQESVPQIRFHDSELTNRTTLRDMLAHRTGISRHDSIWYDSGFSGQELFERLQFLEPSAGLRERFLYNNLMYAAAGDIIELKSGIPWAAFVRQRILEPLSMRATSFGVATSLRTASNAVVPYAERRDSTELYELPLWEAVDAGAAPAGAMVSNIEDLSHWLIALMNEGRYAGRQVLPAAVLKATLEPAIAMSNDNYEARGWREVVNPVYGMGRKRVVYRGHLLTSHGGDLPGFHTQISYLPAERIGVIVLAISDHTAQLYDPIGYHVYERLLGLEPTPWSERLLELRLKAKAAGKVARARAGEGRVRGTRPSHPLADYAGEYEHPAYGVLKIGLQSKLLQFAFRKFRAEMEHYHYDRFDTPDDEEYGRYAVNFSTNPLGDIDKVTMSLDEGEVTFLRRADRLEPKQIERLLGTYIDPTGRELHIVLQPDAGLAMQTAGGIPTLLRPYRKLRFRTETFSDELYEFVEEGGRITALSHSTPGSVEIAKRR